ncbi:MAG: hypothetical protein HOO99_04065 [Hyphomicrobiaceae bacterium]|nr:hypothetical protein [Hyphomicrobiaceae bacterium]
MPMLTKRQQEVFNAYMRLLKRDGCTPTLTKLCAELNVSSLGVVSKHISALRQARAIGRQKSNRVKVQAGKCPCCGQKLSVPSRQEPQKTAVICNGR